MKEAVLIKCGREAGLHLESIPKRKLSVSTGFPLECLVKLKQQYLGLRDTIKLGACYMLIPSLLDWENRLPFLVHLKFRRGLSWAWLFDRFSNFKVLNFGIFYQRSGILVKNDKCLFNIWNFRIFKILPFKYCIRINLKLYQNIQPNKEFQTPEISGRG